MTASGRTCNRERICVHICALLRISVHIELLRRQPCSGKQRAFNRIITHTCAYMCIIAHLTTNESMRDMLMASCLKILGSDFLKCLCMRSDAQICTQMRVNAFAVLMYTCTLMHRDACRCAIMREYAYVCAR